MTDKNMPFTALIPQKSTLLWCLAIALITMVIQIAGFGREVFDGDESTFILMANELIQGRLPYVQQFDVKPPALFFMLAGVIALFGKSLIAIRIFGDILIILTAILAFLLAKRRTSPMAAGLAALGYVALTRSDFGLYFTAELPATFFLMLALALFILWPQKIMAAFGGGFFISLAVLTRTNLAYVAVAFGLYFLVRAIWVNRQYYRHLLAYVMGGIVPLSVFIIIYAAAGHLEIFLISNIDVPLAYATDQHPMLPVIGKNFAGFILEMKKHPFAFITFTLMVLVGMAVSMKGIWRYQKEKRDISSPKADNIHSDYMTWLMIIPIIFSIATGGIFYEHYWLQFLPMLMIFVAIAVQRYRNKSRMEAIVVTLAMVIAPVIAFAQSLPETTRILSQEDYLQNKHDVRKAAQIIDDLREEGDTLWAIEYHLIHWYLDMPVLSKVATHPSNIIRKPIIETLAEKGYSSRYELGRVMQLHPDFVIDSKERPFFNLPDSEVRRLSGDNSSVHSYLKAHYRIIPTNGDVVIYRHKDEGVSKKGAAEKGASEISQ